MKIAEKIYELRIRQNLSQGDLAEKVDVSRQSVSKWETGTATPDLEKLIKLSGVFGITLDELVGNESTVKTEENEVPNLMTQEQVVEIVEDIKKEFKPVKRKTSDLIINIFGAIFIVFGCLTSFLGAFSFGALLIVLGIISIAVKKNKVETFAWSVFLGATVFTDTATSITSWHSLNSIIYNLKTLGFNNISFLLGLVFLLIFVILCSAKICKAKGKAEKLFALGWCIIIRQVAIVLHSLSAFAYVIINMLNDIQVFDNPDLQKSIIIEIFVDLAFLLIMVVGIVVARKVYLKKKMVCETMVR